MAKEDVAGTVRKSRDVPQRNKDEFGNFTVTIISPVQDVTYSTNSAYLQFTCVRMDGGRCDQDEVERGT